MSDTKEEVRVERLNLSFYELVGTYLFGLSGALSSLACAAMIQKCFRSLEFDPNMPAPHNFIPGFGVAVPKCSLRNFPDSVTSSKHVAQRENAANLGSESGVGQFV